MNPEMPTFEQAQRKLGNGAHCLKCAEFAPHKVRYVAEDDRNAVATAITTALPVMPEHMEWVCKNCGYTTWSKTADVREAQ